MTDLVPATMKTKVMSVAMPRTKRIYFLKPPSSPKLESSLYSREVVVMVRMMFMQNSSFSCLWMRI